MTTYFNKALLFKNHPVPQWFKNDSFVKSQKTIEKHFSSLGLLSFTDKLSLNSFNTNEKIINYITDRVEDIDSSSLGTIGLVRYGKMLLFLEQAEENVFNNKLRSSIKDENGKVLFKAGTPISKILDYITKATEVFATDSNAELRGAAGDIRSRIYSAKFSNNKDLKVVFSTNPWDILTMSTRGIQSCMNWKHGYGPNSHCLIGSVFDPLTAIIYVTDGKPSKHGHGQRMLARSVVRLVKFGNTNCKKYSLFVENAYADPKFSLSLNDGEHEDEILDVFMSILDKKRVKTNTTADVYSVLNRPTGLYIPKLPQIKDLKDSHLSYSDASLCYK